MSDNYYNHRGWSIMQDNQGYWRVWEPGVSEPLKFFSLRLAKEAVDRRIENKE